MRRFRRFLFLLLFLCFGAGSSWAHKPSDSYLMLEISGSTLLCQWDIALRDLEVVVGLDANGDGNIQWREVLQRESQISSYAFSHLEISEGKERSRLQPSDLELLIDEHLDGSYAVLKFKLKLSRMESIFLKYSLLFDVDPQHRGLLRWGTKEEAQTAILSPEKPSIEIALSGPNESSFLGFVKEGVWHIWTGFDHLAFLLALLLPSVLLRSDGKWIMAPNFRSVFMPVVKIVTAFTVAHSLTLSLAVFHLVELNARFVETTIAASVLLAAANNLYPVFKDRSWLVAFCFGLIHGFGFAGVLQALNLEGGTLVSGLFGFNLGVELGQLGCVLLFLPVAFAARSTAFYRAGSLQLGSAAIAMIAVIWMTERILDFKVLPF